MIYGLICYGKVKKMLKEKAEYTEMWKTGYKKEKPKVDKKERKCMMCYKPFESTWNGNRICSGCKETDDWHYGNDYKVIS